MITNGYLKKEAGNLLLAEQNQRLVTKAYRVTILKQQAPKSVGCVTRETRLLCISSRNVQSWLRPSTRSAMIRSPLCFTENYVASMVLNQANIGMNTEQRR